MVPGARKHWSAEAVRKAVNGVEINRWIFFKASELYQVPCASLENYVNHRSKTTDELLKTKSERKYALGQELECKLALYCKIMDERFSGLRWKVARRLQF